MIWLLPYPSRCESAFGWKSCQRLQYSYDCRLMPSATAVEASQLAGSLELTETSAASIIYAEAVYSTFSRGVQKNASPSPPRPPPCFLASGSFIYYPAVSPLADSLHTSVALINLTITSYLIVSGVVPSIVGDLADRTGRRPLYIVTFAIYFAANIALALQDLYPALFVLRMLQSAGSSGLLALVLHYGIDG